MYSIKEPITEVSLVMKRMCLQDIFQEHLTEESIVKVMTQEEIFYH